MSNKILMIVIILLIFSINAVALTLNVSNTKSNVFEGAPIAVNIYGSTPDSGKQIREFSATIKNFAKKYPAETSSIAVGKTIKVDAGLIAISDGPVFYVINSTKKGDVGTWTIEVTAKQSDNKTVSKTIEVVVDDNWISNLFRKIFTTPDTSYYTIKPLENPEQFKTEQTLDLGSTPDPIEQKILDNCKIDSTIASPDALTKLITSSCDSTVPQISTDSTRVDGTAKLIIDQCNINASNSAQAQETQRQIEQYCKNDNYYAEGIGGNNSQYDSTIVTDIAKAIENSAKNQTASLTPAIPTTTPPIGLSSLQNKINKDVLEYYKCFLDKDKFKSSCDYLRTLAISGYRNWAGEYEGSCQSMLDRANQYKELIDLKSSIPEIQAKTEILPAMNPNITKGIITVESAWIENAIGDASAENPLSRSYGLMQVSGNNLKYGSSGTGWPDYFGELPGEEIIWSNPSNNIARGTSVYRVYNDSVSSRTNCFADNAKILPSISDLQNPSVNWPGVLAIAAYNAGTGSVTCSDGGRITNSNSARTTQHTIAVLAWAKIFNQDSCEDLSGGIITPPAGELKADLTGTPDEVLVGKPMELDVTESSPEKDRTILKYEIIVEDFTPDNAGQVPSREEKTYEFNPSQLKTQISPEPRSWIEFIPETKEGDKGTWKIRLKITQDDEKTDESTPIEIKVVEELTPPTETELIACQNTCTTVNSCLACIDGKFLNEVYK